MLHPDPGLVTAGALADLYGVDPRECVIAEDTVRGRMPGFSPAQWEALEHLYPVQRYERMTDEDRERIRRRLAALR